MLNKVAYTKKSEPSEIKKYLTVVFAITIMAAIYLLPLPQPLSSPEGLVYLTIEGKASGCADLLLFSG